MRSVSWRKLTESLFWLSKQTWFDVNTKLDPNLLTVATSDLTEYPQMILGLKKTTICGYEVKNYLKGPRFIPTDNHFFAVLTEM